MGKIVDFLFVYEVKNREVENICLVANQLRKEGYTVEFVNTWYTINHYYKKYKARVIIGFAGFNSNVVNFVLKHCICAEKYVDMQWEQLLGDVDISDITKFQGKARNVVHISWGKDNYNRLTNYYGLDKEKCLLCGHLTMDFYRPQLRGYYLSREELLKQYHIPENKKIILYISSGNSLINQPEKQLQNIRDIMKCTDGQLNELICQLIKTEQTIEDWIVKFLKAHKEYCLVYRPHEGDRIYKKFRQLEKQMDSLYIIGGRSIKQWILCSDICFTTLSTAISEVFFAGKQCGILRPFPIPQFADLELFHGAQTITTYSGFEKAARKGLDQFPIREEKIRSYYYVSEKQACYQRISKHLIRILKDSNFNMPSGYNLNANYWRRLQWILSTTHIYKRYIMRCLNSDSSRKNVIKIKGKYDKDYLKFIKEEQRANYMTKQQLYAMMDHIDHTICKNRDLLPG